MVADDSMHARNGGQASDVGRGKFRLDEIDADAQHGDEPTQRKRQ